MVEDYLSIYENIVNISNSLAGAMDKVPTAEEGNLPVFDDVGQVEDSGESIDTLRARSYFYGRTY